MTKMSKYKNKFINTFYFILNNVVYDMTTHLFEERRHNTMLFGKKNSCRKILIIVGHKNFSVLDVSINL